MPSTRASDPTTNSTTGILFVIATLNPMAGLYFAMFLQGGEDA